MLIMIIIPFSASVAVFTSGLSSLTVFSRVLKSQTFPSVLCSSSLLYSLISVKLHDSSLNLLSSSSCWWIVSLTRQKWKAHYRPNSHRSDRVVLSELTPLCMSNEAQWWKITVSRPWLMAACWGYFSIAEPSALKLWCTFSTVHFLRSTDLMSGEASQVRTSDEVIFRFKGAW